MAKDKCKRTTRIAKQRRNGNIFCYREEVARLVAITVQTDGYNICTCKACPFSGTPILQEYD